MDPGSGDKDRNLSDKWSFFGPRPLPKSDSRDFNIQAYKGAQKPTPVDLICALASRMAADPATFRPPKIDVPVIEWKEQPLRNGNPKLWDLNMLTIIGFKNAFYQRDSYLGSDISMVCFSQSLLN
jgi:hypothetical protein